ncbi:hypothetical protein ACLQ28_24280 [Micromonospora sp. DT201]|uniref:hypothetical protein n=1 Tax=Micromonospora sp. DT201 TaxID=3393442 RepID=UPI003CEE3A2C
MDIRTVDPRDQTWEIWQPKYRVHFHDKTGAAEEYEVEGVDVSQVMAWAAERCDGRTFVVYACVPCGGLGLLRLAGIDPTERHLGPGSSQAMGRQQR